MGKHNEAVGFLHFNSQVSEKLEPSYIAGGNARLYSYLGKQLTVLITLNINLAFNPTIPLLGIYQKEMKIYVHTKIYIYGCL